jgi:hypothetical protein
LKLLNGVRAGRQSMHATPCMVTRQSPYTTNDHRTHGVVLTRSRVASRGTRLPFPSPSCHPTTALLHSPPHRLCSSWPTTTELLPSSSKSGKRLVIIASSSSAELELEPLVIDAGRASCTYFLYLSVGLHAGSCCLVGIPMCYILPHIILIT